MRAAKSRWASSEPRWYTTRERPLTREDLGAPLIAHDCHGNKIIGTLTEEGGVVVLRPSHAVLRLTIPVSLLSEYQFARSEG
jgi:hypothetical protein